MSEVNTLMTNKINADSHFQVTVKIWGFVDLCWGFFSTAIYYG